MKVVLPFAMSIATAYAVGAVSPLVIDTPYVVVHAVSQTHFPHLLIPFSSTDAVQCVPTQIDWAGGVGGYPL